MRVWEEASSYTSSEEEGEEEDYDKMDLECEEMYGDQD